MMTTYDEDLFQMQQEFTSTVKNAKALDPKLGQQIENFACELIFATKGSLVATLGIYNLTGTEAILRQIPMFFNQARSEFVDKVILTFDKYHLEKCLAISADLQ